MIPANNIGITGKGDRKTQWDASAVTSEFCGAAVMGRIFIICGLPTGWVRYLKINTG